MKSVSAKSSSILDASDSCFWIAEFYLDAEKFFLVRFPYFIFSFSSYSTLYVLFYPPISLGVINGRCESIFILLASVKSISLGDKTFNLEPFLDFSASIIFDLLSFSFISATFESFTFYLSPPLNKIPPFFISTSCPG